MEENEKIINFYLPREGFGCFSNFSRHHVFLKNKIWKTTEHYFQAQKFPDTEFEEQIRLAHSPKEAAEWAEIGKNRFVKIGKQ